MHAGREYTRRVYHSSHWQSAPALPDQDPRTVEHMWYGRSHQHRNQDWAARHKEQQVAQRRQQRGLTGALPPKRPPADGAADGAEHASVPWRTYAALDAAATGGGGVSARVTVGLDAVQAARSKAAAAASASEGADAQSGTGADDAEAGCGPPVVARPSEMYERDAWPRIE